MTGFCNTLLEDKRIAELKKYNSSGGIPAGVLGASYIHKVNLAALLCGECGGIVITPNESEAIKTANDLCAFGVDAVHFPSKDFVLRPIDGISREYEHKRLTVLDSMLSGKKTVVCSVDAAMQTTIPPEVLKSNSFTLNKGDKLDINELSEKLVSAGYVRAYQVDTIGQFSVRGGIVDIFSPAFSNPVRFEFWGDEIEQIFLFDAESQRRAGNISSLRVVPSSETVFEREELAQKIENLAGSIRKKESPARESLLKDAEALKAGSDIPADRFLPIMYSRTATVFDYASNCPMVVFESSKVKESANAYTFRMNEDITGLLEDGILCKGLGEYCIGFSELCRKYESFHTVYADSLPRGSFDTPVGYLLNITAKQLPAWNGLIKLLCEDLNPFLNDGYTCVVACPTKKGARSVCDDLINEGFNAIFFDSVPEIFPSRAVSVVAAPVSASMEYPEIKFAVITHSNSVVSPTPKKKKSSKLPGLTSLEELRKGDYVVHTVHGIGVFEGIHNIEFQGIKKDYIKIRYAKDDAIYVPVTQLDLVSRYIGSRDESKIKLSKLGSTEWQKAKARARSVVRDIANELVELYSKRSITPGYAFASDGELQKDFECDFEFEETDDQLRCAAEIKRDMEKPLPMDRLLCGDVGFGKTEVALRAAFKCVCEGKQCVMLVPTTILAFQHFGTITKRFGNYPIEVRMLSRFCSAKQQREIKKDLKSGKIDIVVGTHKLLSKDIEYSDVGLLIVDEEQRFGVSQKERLKELFPGVDVLTLSATPIPRTLNMAMSGIRDMSVLEEAPQNRYPVQTYVLEHNEAVIMQAIRKELARGGQCYYLHNNIETISRIAFKISQEIEGARVAVAHGKMGEEELSEIWRRLLQNEIDVLVCTTIIETGIDVPNVNTLIIENADKMGLSQLHQIRGRVGRSQRRAFAYLTFRRGMELSEIASSRLEAIKEFTQFGAGFKIAIRDLEIRGAGNILGAQQHGHMEAIGYDMYIKMLGEAIKEKKGEASALDKPDCLVDLQIEAHIPEKYIEGVAQRLSVYRKIADINNKEDADEVIAELTDRFGKPPKAVLGLIEVALLRNRAASLNIYEVRQNKEGLLLFVSNIAPETVNALSKLMKKRISVGTRVGKEYISVKMLPGQESMDTLREVLKNYETLQ